ncbi:hypothetical protein ACFS32_12590 [Novosphingobium pokkalii]|uniref:hypothetical protein n=1 Tax=Novosphingobium pokkalii TaxID=1770194 RepID=UPI00362FA24A
MLPLLKQVNLAGLVLLSPALVIGPQGDSELVEALPATAVAAAAHGRGALAGLPPAQVEARAAAFAAGPYARALLAGSALAPAEQARVAAQMARLIGLPRRRSALRACGLTWRCFAPRCWLIRARWWAGSTVAWPRRARRRWPGDHRRPAIPRWGWARAM